MNGKGELECIYWRGKLGIYEGNFQNGKYEGSGTYIWEGGINEGMKYIGEWKSGKLQLNDR